MVLCKYVYPCIAVVYPNPLQPKAAGDILCTQEHEEFYDYIRERK